MDYFERNAGSRRRWEPTPADTIEADDTLSGAFTGRDGVVVESEERFDSKSGLYRRLAELLPMPSEEDKS